MPFTESGPNSAAQSYVIFDDPLQLSSTDQPTSRLVTYNVTENNFLLWKCDFYLDLIAKNKERFIDGSCKMPAKIDKIYHQRIRCELMVDEMIAQSY
ncbi:hypothetical protein vseg_019611 [Gypsophila vaccaria]